MLFVSFRFQDSKPVFQFIYAVPGKSADMYHAAAVFGDLLKKALCFFIHAEFFGVLRYVALVQRNKKRYAPFPEKIRQLCIDLSESLCSIYYQYGYVRLFEYLFSPLYTKLSKAALIVKTRCIDDYHRSERQYLHRFFHRVCRSPPDLRNHCKILTGHRVHHARLTGVPASEEPYMYSFAARRLIHSCHNHYLFC